MTSKPWTVLGLLVVVVGVASGVLVSAWMTRGEPPARIPHYESPVAVVSPVQPAVASDSPVAAAAVSGPVGEEGRGASPGSGDPARPPVAGPSGARVPQGQEGGTEGVSPTSGVAASSPTPPESGPYTERGPRERRRVAQGPPGPEPPLNPGGNVETPEMPSPTPKAGAKKGTSTSPARAKGGKPSKDAEKGSHGDKGGEAGAPAILHDRVRPLEQWKPLIARYSKRHYGEEEWKLEPTCIVLHFTAGSTFPWNLVNSASFAGEPPGLATHYVIDGSRIWELLPPDVRCRGAYGINHRAISIEMVATNASDLSRRPETLKSCVALVRYLMGRFDIPKARIYSHAEVSRMDRKKVPEVKDLVDSSPYGKPDPGEQNMRTIKAQL